MKLTIIGAGSSYTPELIEGIINNQKHLNLTELYMNDVELGRHKLDVIFDLTKRMLKKAGLEKVKVVKSLDKIQCIKDADFIVTQIRVGGLDTRIIDERVPIKYNFLGQETNGFGGMFKAMRTIPVIFDIVDKVKKHAKPNAWIINFSNPAGVVTEAVHKYKDFKRFVGVCNCEIHLEMMIAQYLNTQREQLVMDWVGLNHLAFGNNVHFEGKEITKKVVEALTDEAQVDKFTMRNVPPIPYEPNFLRALNLIPVPYYRYFVKYDEMIAEEVMKAKKNNSRAEFVKEVEKQLFEKYSDPELDVKPKELELRGGAFYSKVAIEVLTALAGGPESRHAVNYPNNGTVKNFPKDRVIEISSIISKDSIKQVDTVKNIPDPVFGLVVLVKNYELKVIEAAISGDYETALLAANISPFTRNDIVNKQVLDEMLEAHKKYLPKFFNEKEIFE